MFYQSQAAGVNHSVNHNRSNHNRSVQSAIEDLKIDDPSMVNDDETKENNLAASQIPKIAS